MSRQKVTISIGASVFGADGRRIGTVDRISGDVVDVSGHSIPQRAFVRGDDDGLYLNTSRDTLLSGAPARGGSTTMDTFVTEQDQMNRAVEDARQIDPPRPAAGSLADPVAGSGFTRDQPDRGNPLGDTTVSQPFEDLGELDEGSGDSPDARQAGQVNSTAFRRSRR